MSMTDRRYRVFVVVDGSLEPGRQITQAVHGQRQLAADYPEIERKWFERSNHVVVLSAKDGEHLQKLALAVRLKGMQLSVWREPDLGGRATAIAAFEPAARILFVIPLALS
jgi:hypothetical protein